MLSMPRIVRPDPHRFRGTEFGFPAGRATRRSIKRNKELAKSLTGKCDSQVSHSLPAHFRFPSSLGRRLVATERSRRWKRKIAKAASRKEKFQLASDVRNDKRTEVLRRPGSSSRAANISGRRPKGHAGHNLAELYRVPTKSL